MKNSKVLNTIGALLRPGSFKNRSPGSLDNRGSQDGHVIPSGETHMSDVDVAEPRSSTNTKENPGTVSGSLESPAVLLPSDENILPTGNRKLGATGMLPTQNLC